MIMSFLTAPIASFHARGAEARGTPRTERARPRVPRRTQHSPPTSLTELASRTPLARACGLRSRMDLRCQWTSQRGTMCSGGDGMPRPRHRYYHTCLPFALLSLSLSTCTLPIFGGRCHRPASVVVPCPLPMHTRAHLGVARTRRFPSQSLKVSTMHLCAPIGIL